MSVLSDVGGFFKGIGDGVVSAVKGIGGSFSAKANYNQSIANLQNAQAAALPTIIEAERQRQEQAHKQAMLIIALLFLVPIGVILTILMKKS